MRNETVTNVFWGLFLVWFGVSWALQGSDFFSTLQSNRFALGTGVLLLALNFTRSMLHLKVSGLTIGLGVLLVVVYAPLILLHTPVPFLPALVIIAGLALIIGAFRTRKYL